MVLNEPLIPRGTGKEATLSKAIFGTFIGAVVLVVALILTLALTLSVGDGAPRSAPNVNAPLVPGGDNTVLQAPGSEFPPTLPVPPTLAPATLPPIPGGTPSTNLPTTTAGRLFVAESGTRSNGQPRVVARSYDNGPWEAMRDEDFEAMQVRCAGTTSSGCVLYGDAAANIRELPVPAYAQNVDAMGRAARLLNQFSFGATMAELTAASAQTPKQWMDAQMSLYPSLLRSYIRQRTNPPQKNLWDLGNLHGICEVGARYRPVGGGGSGANTQTLGDADVEFAPIGTGDDVVITRVSNCDQYRYTGNHTAYLVHQGQVYAHQPRVRWLNNTFGLPAGGIPGQMCPAVPKTFVNSWSCRRRASCGAPAVTSIPLTLNDATLRRWYTGSAKYIYVVKGLLLTAPYDVSPCSGRSRWEQTAGACPTPSTLDATTQSVIGSAITAVLDPNPFVRDIELPGGNGCVAAPGSHLEVSGVCWKHVHPHLYQVRDFTHWGTGTVHPGNEVTPGVPRNPNPIYKWAINGGTELTFPASHPMSRWADNDNMRHIPVVGRYGDTINYLTLSTELQTPDMGVYAGAAGSAPAGSFESCGVAGEIANDGRLGHRYIVSRDDVDDDDHRAGLDWRYNFEMGKSIAWMNNAIKAPDQLRQRVAWALQQIFTIGDNGELHRRLTDTWASYYDIFVRHAFGNYRDMMKEVSFHPLMADYLTYRNSRSYELTDAFPDENYAREIMQLFSIGLYKLNLDGTRVLENGQLVDSYTDTDIVDFARIWTGFVRQQSRSNIEQIDGESINGIDPLRINPSLRDKLPKAKLDKGFIGDQYPLCTELPPHHWLRPGAKWVYTGGSSAEGDVMDEHNNVTFQNRPRFIPAVDSPLFNKLCGNLVNGECSFPSEVVLDEIIPCTGAECNVQDVVTAKIQRGSLVGYFTYVSIPCVRLAFFNGGRVLSEDRAHQCGNPIDAVGNPTCCDPQDPDSVESDRTTAGLCSHANERANFDVVKARCEAAGLVMCKRIIRRRGISWANSCASEQPIWVDESCNVTLQVLPTGRVMVNANLTGIEFFSETNGNQFRVRWENNDFPTVTAGCGAGCRRVDTASDPTCVCDVTVSEAPLFTGAMPSPVQVVNEALIGSAPPSSFDAGAYLLCNTPECTSNNKMRVWLKQGTTDWKTTTTIFEIDPVIHASDPVRYLMNRVSTVSLTGQPARKFQNPPHFMPLWGEYLTSDTPHRNTDLWLPRATWEVDALLDHLFYHENTAPFVAYRLIQRMVTSNPSLRYVRSVATAFIRGYYDGTPYSGRYGDMGAAVAAVLLDQEARSTTVEADPRHGSLQEPLIKVMRFMRSLEFKTRDGREIMLPTSHSRIDQAAFKQPSVFGFYLPEFRPDGPVEDAGLVGPEAQILTTPSIVHYLNGMSSLINYGLTSCRGGFGYDFNRTCGSATTRRDSADGFLTYQPVATTGVAIVDELNVLLTAKRLAPETATFLAAEYDKELVSDDAATAYRGLLKRFMATIEYQVNNLHVLSPVVRPPVNFAGGGQNRQYKAIVVIFMGGGADSFNMIVPHSQCGKDYYGEYAAVRTNAAIPFNALLPITVAGQPCGRFGVHPEFSDIKQLYDDGDAAFFANIGGLVEPMTKQEYRDRSKMRPPSPSAHNIAQRTLQNLHAQESNAKGILGRAVDSLKTAPTPYAVESYSLAGNQKMMQGILSKPDLISASRGVIALEDKTFVTHAVNNVTRFMTNTTFGETYASLVGESLQKNDRIGDLLATSTVPDFGNGYNQQLEQVAKLIKIRGDLGTERAVFFTSRGGWDTHTRLNPPWQSVNDAVKSFADEMKAQGIWDNVAVVSVSDFGRTLTSNGAGTDHAWGGNMFILGGGVRGGKFHGKFPDTLKGDGAENLGGRGRLIPTLGWESMWEGVLEWFDVPAAQMDNVMPNRPRFNAQTLIKRADMFTN